MSGRRPIERIVAKNKKTKEYVDLGAVWPCRFEGEDYPRGVTFGDNRTSLERVVEILSSGEWYVDVRHNEPPSSSGSEEW